jgi:adenosylcobinamide-GDP ribazoletransferase
VSQDENAGQHGPEAWVVMVGQALRFYSRLPVPALPGESDAASPPDFAALPRALPLAGAIIGAVGALALAIACGILALPATVGAAFATAALVLTTGAMHEDGLADTADGLGGGTTRERRLEIMRDSRIGSYGAAALALALLMRVLILAALVDAEGWPTAAFALVAAAAVSRLAGLLPLWMLPAARTDGLASSVGRPSDASMAIGGLVALTVAIGCLAWTIPLAKVLAACAAALLAVLPLVSLARRLIGGQTGDVAGAAQQFAEIAFLAILAAGTG